MEDFLKFVREAFCDESGGAMVGSFSRMATAVILVVVLWMLAHVVRHNHQFPDAATLAGMSAFIGTLYVSNRLTAK